MSIKKKEARYLVPDAPRLPVIYQLPKIHKNSECPPGRPIISAINSILSRIGEYVDFFLQPIVQPYPSYLRDSKHLMNLLKDIPVHDNTIIVTIDVESLYTNLVQKDVLITTRRALDSKSNLKMEQKEFLIEVLELAMSNNYFWHEGSCYKQIKGVAMGAKYAPSVANILMSQWEEHSIFGAHIPEISLYKIYIDDTVIL